MVRLFLILFVFVPLTGTSQVWKVNAASNESPANYVYISGETNINCFECRYTKNKNDNLYQDFQLNHDKISGESVKAEIPVSQFECSNEIMYNDFRKLLNADEYPYIRIEIDPSQIKSPLPGKSSNSDLKVSITIASITKVQPVSCRITNPGNNTISISGITTINIIDFHLEPPVKFLGLVRVKDEVRINFSFNFIVV
jgi:polyisoprenoid-binding protein YceI